MKPNPFIQYQYLLNLPILTLCYATTTFYRLPLPVCVECCWKAGKKRTKKYYVFRILYLTFVNYVVTVSLMIIEIIRKQIRTCGKSRYQISAETGIDNAALCRIMQGGSCKAETADILLKYFGLTIVKKTKKGTR